MKKFIATLLVCIVFLTGYSQTRYTDKFDYMARTETFKQRTGGNICQGDKTDLFVQLTNFLKNFGEDGWELVSDIQTIKEPTAALGCDFRYLTVTMILKRTKYNTKSEIEKDIALYTKKYADSVAQVMITEINKMTWSQMGQHYKKDIVDQIIQEMKLLLEALKPNN